MTLTRAMVFMAGAVIALASSAQAQQRDRTAKPLERPVGTSVIAGKVTASEMGDTPVRRAVVTLVSSDRVESVSAVTDNEGRFAFTALVDGRYTLNARKAAHLSMNYGAKRPGRPGTTLILTAGQQLTDLRLVLAPGAVIAGVVRMPTGEPAPNVSVAAIPRSYATPGSRPVDLNAFKTDDRGEFRIYGLVPDSYLVAALPANLRTEIHQRTVAEYEELVRTLARRAGQPAGTAPVPPPPPVPLVGFAPTYFPGTAVAANASMVTVRAGDVRDGLDIPLALVRVATVSGVVRSVDGRPLRDVQLSVTEVGPMLPVVLPITSTYSVLATRPDVDGHFKMTNVPPGSYRVTARAGGITFNSTGTSVTIEPAQQTQWAIADFQVQGEDVEGVSLQLQPGLNLSGRIVATGTGKVPDTLKGVTVRLQEPRASTSVSGQRSANVQDDGAFEITGIQPANYELEVTLPLALRSVWSVKSIMTGGRELRDAPLTIDQGSLTGVTITLTDQPSQLAGTLSSASGQAATDYYVVLFPAERALWHERSPRLRVMRPAADGGFSTRDLLPGTYRIAALTDVEEGEWRTAAFLESVFDASIAVTVVEGQTARQDVRIR